MALESKGKETASGTKTQKLVTCRFERKNFASFLCIELESRGRIATAQVTLSSVIRGCTANMESRVEVTHARTNERICDTGNKDRIHLRGTSGPGALKCPAQAKLTSLGGRVRPNRTT